MNLMAAAESGALANWCARAARPRVDGEPLLDHLVGERDQGWGKAKSECVRRLRVDDKLEARDLHRQVRRLLAIDDPTGVDAGLPRGLGDAAAVAHQAAGCGELAIGRDRR